MEGTSSSSSYSCASFGSFDEDVPAAKPPYGATTIKFLCSYGGKILPRYRDGKLRYVGGDTRVIAVDRSIPFSELQEKMRVLCGWGAAGVRCQLPTEDLDALVSLKSDEDVANVVGEYDRAGREKIRAFLFSPSSKSSTHPATPISAVPEGRGPSRCVYQTSAPARTAGWCQKIVAAGDLRSHGGYHHHPHGHPATSRTSNYLVHHGSHWQ